MAGKRYSAGRVFLQVMPAFDGLQKAIGKKVDDINADLEKKAEESGRRAGERRAKAEAKAEAPIREEARKAEEEADKKAEGRKTDRAKTSEKETAKRKKKALDASTRDEIAAAKKVLDAELAGIQARAKAEADAARKRAARRDRAGRKALDDASASPKAIQDRARARIENSARVLAKELDAIERRSRAESLAAAEKMRGITDATRTEQQLRDKEAKESLDRSNLVTQEELDNIERVSKEQKKAADDQAQRDEANRSRIRRRRAAERLENMRANERDRLKAQADADRNQGGAFGRLFRKSTLAAAMDLPDEKIDENSSAAQRKVAALRAELMALSKVRIGVDLDADTAMAKVAYIEKELFELARNSPEVDVDANVLGAMMNLKRLERQIDQINRKQSRNMLTSMFVGLSRSAEDGANSFRVFNPRVLALVALLPALVPLLASTGAALGALATAGTGAAAGLGVTILAFSGIKDIVSGLSEVQENSAKDTLARTKAIRNAAKGVRDAEQGLARTRTSTARAAEDAARRVSDANRSAAERVRAALQTQEDAERSLADAQRNATDAQEDLRRARKQAQQDQLDLADQIKKGILDERQALIDLFNAQVEYNGVMASGGSTNLEKEQSSINLERAQLAIKQIRDSNRDLAAAEADSSKKGVEGSDAVVGAKRQQADATRAVEDAERRLAESTRDVAQARIDGARDIADALREQREQQVDGAIAMRDANERVTDAQAAYNEALTQTGEIGSSSMDKLRKAMANVGPEGIAFARFIFGLRDGFYELRRIAQAGILPGVEEAMRSVGGKYGRSFFDFVDKMSKVVGDLFRSLGESLNSPVMANFFAMMDEYAPTFTRLFGEVFISIMEIIAGLMTAFAPFAETFMEGMADMLASASDWAEGLKDDEGFKGFIAYVLQEGPKVLGLIKDIIITLVNIGKGMADNGSFDALTGFFSFLADLDPVVIGTIVQAILGMFVASQVSAGIVSLTIAFKLLTGTLTGVVILGLFAIIAAFVVLYKNNETFRKVMDAVWSWITKVVSNFIDWFRDEAMPVIGKVFSKIGEGLSYLWTNIFQPIFSMIWDIVKVVFTVIAWYYENVLWPVFKAMAKVVWWVWSEVFWPVLSKIVKFWAAQIQAIKWVWDNVLKPVFTAIIDALAGPMSKAWESFTGYLGKMWTEIQKVARDGVNGVIGILNGLIKGFNKVMEALGSEFRVSMIGDVTWGIKDNSDGRAKSKGGGVSTKGGSFDTGGYTGPGGKYEEAGIVHKDEYVIRKESTNKLRQKFGLGWLDYLNREGEVPGYADGGLVGFGRLLQKMGYQVGQHPAFGPVGKHGKGSLHYKGKAIDVNYDGFGQAKENAMLDAIVEMARARGFGMKWRVKDHFGHAHIDDGGSWSVNGIVGKVVGAAIEAPIDGLRKIVDGLMSKVPGNGIVGGLKMMPGKILGAAGDKIEEWLSGGPGYEGANDDSGAGVEKWRTTVLAALGRVKQPSSLADLTLRRMMQESSGNPRAINLWDSNARKGIPSKGLMQVIDPTFAAYRDAGLPDDIWNPMANIVASMNYALRQYGSLTAAYGRKGGYASGGLVGGYPDNGAKLYDDGGYLQPGWTQVLNATGRPEPVFTPEQLAAGGIGARGPLFGEVHNHLHGTNLTAGDVVDEMMWKVRTIEAGGRYAGAGVGGN